MRCLSFARGLAGGEDWFGLLIAHCEEAPASRSTHGDLAAFRGILRPEIQDRFGVISYERIIWILRQFGEDDLAQWTDDFLARGLAISG